MSTKKMSNKEIAEWNAQVDENRKRVIELWNKLNRKPTLEEIKEVTQENK